MISRAGVWLRQHLGNQIAPLLARRVASQGLYCQTSVMSRRTWGMTFPGRHTAGIVVGSGMHTGWPQAEFNTSRNP